MSTSIDISKSIKGSPLIDLFTTLDRVARAEEIDYFVVGATARDLILEHGFGVSAGRATLDVDIGIQAESWEVFERLRNALLDTNLFVSQRQSQRLRFHKDELPVDILPFGSISNKEDSIRWPNEDGVEMNVQGFDCAYASSLVVILQPDPRLEIRVASPAGLVLLKLIAWRDRRASTSKDVDDLSVIINNYLKIEGIERVTEEHLDLLNDSELDLDRVGAQLLGRDLAMMVDTGMSEALIEILDEILETDAGYQFVYRYTGSAGNEEDSEAVIKAIRSELKQSTS